MVRRLGELSARFARRWVPDPFVFAILLTAFAGGLAIFLGPQLQELSLGARVRAVSRFWISPEEGFWRLLSFGMQMTVILVTGTAG